MSPGDSSLDARMERLDRDGWFVWPDAIGSALIDIRRLNLGSGSTPMTLSQHQAILDAIAAGDPASARVAMAAHLEGVAAWWRENLAPRDGAVTE